MLRELTSNEIDLFSSIQAGCDAVLGPNRAIIAGGALRDAHFDVRAKDIDVFVNISSELELEMVVDEIGYAIARISGYPYEGSSGIEFVGHEYAREMRDNNPRMEGMSHVNGVKNLWFNGIRCAVQLIAKELPDQEFTGPNLVNTFDYNLVKIYWDNGMVASEETMRDIAARTIRLTFPEDERTLNRIAKWLRRTELEMSNAVLPETRWFTEPLVAEAISNHDLYLVDFTNLERKNKNLYQDYNIIRGSDLKWHLNNKGAYNRYIPLLGWADYKKQKIKEGQAKSVHEYTGGFNSLEELTSIYQDFAETTVDDPYKNFADYVLNELYQPITITPPMPVS